MALCSAATNLVPGDTNGHGDVVALHHDGVEIAADRVGWLRSHLLEEPGGN